MRMTLYVLSALLHYRLDSYMYTLKNHIIFFLNETPQRGSYCLQGVWINKYKWLKSLQYYMSKLRQQKICSIYKDQKYYIWFTEKMICLETKGNKLNRFW